MSESVGERDRLINTLALAGLKERGDARSVWLAIVYCVEHGVEFPPWVLSYLSETAAQIEEHLVHRDQRHPQRLWEALGLNYEWKAEHYDREKDPEQVYEVIKTWLTDGEVKTVAEGARRYHEDVLGEVLEPETVRWLYYAGRKIANAGATAKG